ncbi:DUF488 domain-containing protein [Planococcus sp. ISL-110]|nr:hypothetical protein [Planococcus sp. ISL-110]
MTEEFQQGIGVLLEKAAVNRMAYCCSERHPSQCHRLLISNHLTVKGG